MFTSGLRDEAFHRRRFYITDPAPGEVEPLLVVASVANDEVSHGVYQARTHRRGASAEHRT
jgi:hypothetical protein